jgi:hypothetical protein
MICDHTYIRITASSWRDAPYDKCSKCGDVLEVVEDTAAEMPEPVLKKVEYGAYHQPGLNRYDVLVDDRRIGSVYSHFPTLQGPNIGGRVVAWRRQGKTPEWRYETAQNPGRWKSAYTRAACVKALLDEHAKSSKDVSKS